MPEIKCANPYCDICGDPLPEDWDASKHDTSFSNFVKGLPDDEQREVAKQRYYIAAREYEDFAWQARQAQAKAHAAYQRREVLRLEAGLPLPEFHLVSRP